MISEIILSDITLAPWLNELNEEGVGQERLKNKLNDTNDKNLYEHFIRTSISNT